MGLSEPYEPLAAPLAHPDRLYVAARAIGIAAAPPAQARVLWLGCGDASALLALAFRGAGKSFTGVERDPKLVARAEEGRDRLGLEVHIARGEPWEIEGEHDVVIAHGVLSRADESSREKIWSALRGALAPGGVAYASYDCAPGWSVRGELRRALLARADGKEGGQARVDAARELLDVLASAPDMATTFGRLLIEEVAAARTLSDGALLAELLSPHAHPFRFGEVIGRAEAHGLAFVAELARAAPGVAAQGALRGALALGGAIETEELVDLVTYRQHRATLFARREEVEAARPPEPLAYVHDLRVAGHLWPEAEHPSLDDGASEQMIGGGGVRIAVQSALLKSALIELSEARPRSVPFVDLVRAAHARLIKRRVRAEGSSPGDDDVAALANDLASLAELGCAELRSVEAPFEPAVGERPRTSPLTRWEAARGSFVTTPLGRVAKLDPFIALLVARLDGSRSLDELRAELASAEPAEVSAARVDDALAALAALGLLVR